MSTINGRLLNIPNVNDFKEHLDALEANKQNNLIPGENIKNIDGNSIVGSGNVPFKTLNGEQLSGEGNIDIHNEPLIIKTSFSSGNILYDGTEAVEAEISPITTVTEPVEYTYDSQLKFYRESLNEEQLDSVYYIGVNKPITTTIQITNEKVPTPIDADGILKVFTPSFTDIFTEQEIEVSSKACLYVKKTEPDKPEDAYLQFGNGDDNSGWIKLKLNKKQAYLYIKAKMFKASERPGSIFVVEDLSKLDDIDFDASEIADNLVFNYSETLVTSENEWQIIKVPVQSESQIVYITNGRNFGNPGGPSITCDYKRDEYGHIDWERNLETGEIIGGRVDWDHELYGGRILIKEIGIQYEEELEAKTLFTADQFADYKATADYRFTNIEEVNEAQYSYLNEIDTHLNKVDEEFTEKFNNLGDVQIYTVVELPERVHVEDKSKIFKCDNHYYVVDINNSYVDTTTRFTFKNNRHTFSNNITTTGSLASSFSQIYDTSNRTTLMSNFELPDGSITSENKLFGSGNTYKSDTQNADLFGNKYLRFGAKSAGGKLVLEYIDPSNTKALTQISFWLLPWINVTSTVNPETGERVKHIDSLSRSAIKIYRNTEDNLIDAALIDCGSIVSGEYEYSQEGFNSLVDNCANSWYFEIQLMPGDKIIIKSDNNVIINGEEITGLDYRFFIVGINITTENTKVKFKEPFVTTDTDQPIEGKKSFNQTITISNIGEDNALINIDGSDGIYNFLSYHPEFGHDAGYLVLYNTRCINPNTNGYGLCIPSTGSYTEDKTIAIDEDVVHKSGNEVIYGNKTFSSQVDFTTMAVNFGSGTNITIAGNIKKSSEDTYGLTLPTPTASWTGYRTIATEDYVDNALSNKADLVSGKVPASQLPSYVDDVLNISSIETIYSKLSELPDATAQNNGVVYLCKNSNQEDEESLKLVDSSIWAVGFLIANVLQEDGTRKWQYNSTLEPQKIYVVLDTNKTFRYTMAGETHLVEISASLALGETAGSAYAGAKGKANADAIASLKENKLDKVTGITDYTQVYAKTGNTGEQAMLEVSSAAIPHNIVTRDANNLFDVVTPVNDSNPTTKKYVDSALSSKADLINGLVPASQLPSYVDDVLESSDAAHFPSIGEEGKIYVALDTGFTYRWSGSEYVQIGGQDLSNFVTLDTDQTIAGVKTFNKINTNDISSNGDLYFGGASYYTVCRSVSLLPGANDNRSLGNSNLKWKNLYISGNLSDGTNSITVAKIANNDNVVHKSGEEVIYGNKTFSSQVDFTTMAVNFGSGTNITIAGNIKKSSEDTYGLTLPTPTASWTGYRTIATTDDIRSYSISVPACPATTDGIYVLQATVSNGAVTYNWVLAQSVNL